jgi:hypothetical protein
MVWPRLSNFILHYVHSKLFENIMMGNLNNRQNQKYQTLTFTIDPIVLLTQSEQERGEKNGTARNGIIGNTGNIITSKLFFCINQP